MNHHHRRETEGSVLVVDDDDLNADLLDRVLTRAGYEVRVASSGEMALDAVAEKSPDVVVLDVMMPGLGGFEVCRRLKSDARTRLIPIILLTALTERRNRLEGLGTGADHYLTKPVDVQELKTRIRTLIGFKRFTDRLDSAEAVFVSLALTIEARDPYTQDHCQRLAVYAGRLGRHLGLCRDEQNILYLGGFLHDLGKIGVPDAVLLKDGRLTPHERQVMERHTLIGDSFCADLRSLDRVRPIIRHHHERLDGSGYPDNLSETDISLLAQIVSVVDIFDALTTSRVYRGAMSRERALEELQAEVRRGWRSKDIVGGLIELDRDGELGRSLGRNEEPVRIDRRTDEGVYVTS